MENIAEAALYGAIGGAAGAIFGAILRALIPGARRNSLMILLPTIAAAILSIEFADDILRPLVGDFFSETTAESSELDAAMAEVERVSPVLAAIFARDPAAKREFREQISEIVRTSNTQNGAERRGFLLGSDFVAAKLNGYLVRARSDDLLRFFSTARDGVARLLETDPDTCYNYLYYSEGLAASGVEIQFALGPEQFAAEQRVTATLVENAADEPQAYDEEKGARIVAAAVEALQRVMPAEKLGLLNGGGPVSSDDARLACRGTLEMYNALLESDAPVDGLRALLAAA